jgi:hypothetical protein
LEEGDYFLGSTWDSSGVPRLGGRREKCKSPATSWEVRGSFSGKVRYAAAGTSVGMPIIMAKAMIRIAMRAAEDIENVSSGRKAFAQAGVRCGRCRAGLRR